MVRVLILGGTADARSLADKAAERPNIEIITSLAGRTRTPRLPAGEIRIGGFGGVDGLVTYLREARIDLVVDATHPFAAIMSHHAAEACARTEIPCRFLLRPEWAPGPEDRWVDAADAVDAAKKLADIPGSVFLAIGRQELEPFAGLTDRRFLLRMVEPPEAPLPLSQPSIVTGRGPFDLEAEKAMFDAHDIAVVVSKNSGGVSAYAKIEAARARSIPVVMVRRPALPGGPHVESVDDVLAWLEELSR